MTKRYYLSLTLLLLSSLLFTNRMEAQITTYPYLETFGNSGCGLPTGYSNSGSDPWDFQNTSEAYMEGLDHTSGGGCFASMDDSGGATDDSCLLTTPTFDLTSVPGAELRFWWQNSNSTTSTPHTAGPRPWSNLYVDISTNNGVTWTRNAWQVIDSQQIDWAEGVLSLAPYISSTVVIRFRGLETQSFRSDLSLDDIKIFEPQQWDAQMVAINSPTSGGCGDSSAVVEVEVKNLGFDTITMLPVMYQGNNGPVVTDTINTSIMPDAVYTHTFSQNIDLSATGTMNIKAWTDLDFDSIYTNDTVVRAVQTAPTITSYPYFEDFESGQGGWEISGINSSWDFGTPNKNIINGASSGVNAFVNGGLTGTYNVSENSEITGPCFDLTSVQNELWVSLDIWYDAELSWDGAVLQFSVDSGNTWGVVGAVNDPYNWYTDATINGNPGGQQEGWSGTGTNGTNAWVQAKHQLPDSIKGLPYVLFRIAFGSDASIVDDGVAIDNFAIVDYSPVELGLDNFSLCGDGSRTLYAGVTSAGSVIWSDSSMNDSLVVSSQGSYWVEFTDTILNFTTSDTANVVQSTPPSISFAKSVDTLAIPVQSSITLDPNLPFDLEYLWTPGNYDFPYLLVKASEYGIGTHVFNLLVTDSLACTDEQSVTVVIIDVTGFEELSEGELRYFPNPVDDILNVQFNGEIKGNVTLEILNSSGQLMKQMNVSSHANNQFTVDMSDMESGMYILQITMNDKRQVHRLIKR